VLPLLKSSVAAVTVPPRGAVMASNTQPAIRTLAASVAGYFRRARPVRVPSLVPTLRCFEKSAIALSSFVLSIRSPLAKARTVAGERR
jgi:hypothetical protein